MFQASSLLWTLGLFLIATKATSSSSGTWTVRTADFSATCAFSVSRDANQTIPPAYSVSCNTTDIKGIRTAAQVFSNYQQFNLSEPFSLESGGFATVAITDADNPLLPPSYMVDSADNVPFHVVLASFALRNGTEGTELMRGACRQFVLEEQTAHNCFEANEANIYELLCSDGPGFPMANPYIYCRSNVVFFEYSAGEFATIWGTITETPVSADTPSIYTMTLAESAAAYGLDFTAGGKPIFPQFQIPFYVVIDFVIYNVSDHSKVFEFSIKPQKSGPLVKYDNCWQFNMRAETCNRRICQTDGTSKICHGQGDETIVQPFDDCKVPTPAPPLPCTTTTAATPFTGSPIPSKGHGTAFRIQVPHRFLGCTVENYRVSGEPDLTFAVICEDLTKDEYHDANQFALYSDGDLLPFEQPLHLETNRLYTIGYHPKEDVNRELERFSFLPLETHTAVLYEGCHQLYMEELTSRLYTRDGNKIIYITNWATTIQQEEVRICDNPVMTFSYTSDDNSTLSGTITFSQQPEGIKDHSLFIIDYSTKGDTNLTITISKDGVKVRPHVWAALGSVTTVSIISGNTTLYEFGLGWDSNGGVLTLHGCEQFVIGASPKQCITDQSAYFCSSSQEGNVTETGYVDCKIDTKWENDNGDVITNCMIYKNALYGRAPLYSIQCTLYEKLSFRGWELIAYYNDKLFPVNEEFVIPDGESCTFATVRQSDNLNEVHSITIKPTPNGTWIFQLGCPVTTMEDREACYVYWNDVSQYVQMCNYGGVDRPADVFTMCPTSSMKFEYAAIKNMKILGTITMTAQNQSAHNGLENEGVTLQVKFLPNTTIPFPTYNETLYHLSLDFQGNPLHATVNLPSGSVVYANVFDQLGSSLFGFSIVIERSSANVFYSDCPLFSIGDPIVGQICYEGVATKLCYPPQGNPTDHQPYKTCTSTSPAPSLGTTLQSKTSSSGTPTQSPSTVAQSSTTVAQSPSTVITETTSVDMTTSHSIPVLPFLTMTLCILLFSL